MVQNRAWIVAGIFHKSIVCGFLVFAENDTDARQRVFDVLGQIQKIRVEANEMKLVVEEIMDFGQIFSLETFRGNAAWLAGQ